MLVNLLWLTVFIEVSIAEAYPSNSTSTSCIAEVDIIMCIVWIDCRYCQRNLTLIVKTFGGVAEASTVDWQLVEFQKTLSCIRNFVTVHIHLRFQLTIAIVHLKRHLEIFSVTVDHFAESKLFNIFVP